MTYNVFGGTLSLTISHLVNECCYCQVLECWMVYCMLSVAMMVLWCVRAWSVIALRHGYGAPQLICTHVDEMPVSLHCSEIMG